MAPTPDAPDPVRLAEAEGAAIRPTRVLFGLIVTIAAFLGIVPIYVNFLSPDAWQVTAANDRDRFDRIFTDTYMAAATAGVLVAWLGSVYFYRRSLRKALRGCAPKGRGPNGLAETAEFAARELENEFRTFDGLPLGPVYAVVNERSTESFVMGSASRSWLALSISHLMLPAEQLRFIIAHECAHLRMGDHRILQWVPALLRGQLLAYLLCIAPFTYFVLFWPSPMNWLDRSGYLFEDLMFLVITVALLFTAAEILKQREIDADVSAAAGRGGATAALNAAANRSWSASLKNLTAVMAGKRYHPQPADRTSLASSAKEYLKPWRFLPVLCGFLTVLIGNWGYAGTYPGEYENPGPQHGYALMIGLVQYWPRALMALLCAGAVALDLLRSQGPRFKVPRLVWPAVGRFFLGVLLVIPFGMFKGILADMSPEFVIASSITGIPELNLMTSVWQFGWTLAMILVAARWCMRAIPRGFPANRLLRVALMPAALFLLYRIGSAMVVLVGGWDAYAGLWGPVIVMIPLAALWLTRLDLRRYRVCPKCGKATALEDWRTMACTACGSTWAMEPRQPTARWEAARRALPSVAGGAFGGAFLGLIPMMTAVDTLPAKSLAGVYPGLVLSALGLAAEGGLIGAAAYAAMEYPAVLRWLAIAGAAVAVMLLAVKPPATFILFLPAAVIGGLWAVQILRRRYGWGARLRVRIAACVAAAVALVAAGGWPIAAFSAARGYQVGVWRSARGTPADHTISPRRETTRQLGDTVAGAFLVAQGIVTFEAVFGRRRRKTECRTRLEAEALAV